MTPGKNNNAGKRSTKQTTQSLQQAYDEIRSLEEKVAESKRLFERECHLQALLTEDFSKQLTAITRPIHTHLQTSSALIDSIHDEKALWSEAVQMANLTHQAHDTQFESVLRQSERIVETVMRQNYDKYQVTDAIDDLIRTLEAT